MDGDKPTNEATSKKHLLVGEIAAVFGVKGWLKITSWCHPKENIFSYKKWFLVARNQTPETSQQEFEIEGTAYKGRRSMIVKFKGYDSIEETQSLLRHRIFICRSQLPHEEQSFYWFELVGMKVINQEGEFLGHVKTLIETGNNDVLDVQLLKNQQHKRYLIPYLWQHYIVDIQRKEKTIYVDWSSDWLSQ